MPLETKILKNDKAHHKCIYTVKVVNHPHTNMPPKSEIMRWGGHKGRTLETHLKLREQQRKTILYMYRLLYQNFMVTANQKSTIDTHRNKKSNPNTTLKIVIKPQEKRKREGKKKDQQK